MWWWCCIVICTTTQKKKKKTNDQKMGVKQTCKSRRMGTSVSSILAAREIQATDRSWSIQALCCYKKIVTGG
jgi:hypothetical protein